MGHAQWVGHLLPVAHRHLGQQPVELLRHQALCAVCVKPVEQVPDPVQRGLVDGTSRLHLLKHSTSPQTPQTRWSRSDRVDLRENLLDGQRLPWLVRRWPVDAGRRPAPSVVGCCSSRRHHAHRCVVSGRNRGVWGPERVCARSPLASRAEVGEPGFVVEFSVRLEVFGRSQHLGVSRLLAHRAIPSTKRKHLRHGVAVVKAWIVQWLPVVKLVR